MQFVTTRQGARPTEVEATDGHKVDDLVLYHVAEVLEAIARKSDLTWTLGGEEFVLISLSTDRAGAMRLAERTRAAIEHSEVPGISLNEPIRRTLTIGVSDDFIST
ncbi:diguanylate cyclase [Pseudomonas sp. LA21]|uniref:diguanylate cyclase n=1 Tax=Pseudomonas sp. LA21 TaxID=2893373 RepID=UPI0024430848|nr:diguanylate cyclase [Pseudomonas sp. LA21]MCJ1888244.1 diguanylate cyclase [Pseudomonas sp. LA21]